MSAAEGGRCGAEHPPAAGCVNRPIPERRLRQACHLHETTRPAPNCHSPYSPAIRPAWGANGVRIRQTARTSSGRVRATGLLVFGVGAELVEPLLAPGL